MSNIAMLDNDYSSRFTVRTLAKQCNAIDKNDHRHFIRATLKITIHNQYIIIVVDAINIYINIFLTI